MSKLKKWFSFFYWILIGGLVIAIMLAYAYFFSQSPEPSSVPIKLSEVGVVADFKFEVRKHFIYSFSMRFSYSENDQVERARVRKLLGGIAVDKLGKPLEPGTPTPINLTIFAVCRGGQEVAVYSQDVDPILASWGDGRFGKNIGNHVLTPGLYRARLLNKRASPEFKLIPITFEMRMPAKVVFDPEKKPTRSEPCQQ